MTSQVNRYVIADLPEKVARIYGDKTAIKQGNRVRSYRMFRDNVYRLSNALASLGGKGDRVALYSMNSIEFCESLFATFKAGQVIVPINYRLNPNEVLNLLNASKAKILIFQSIFKDVVNKIKSSLETVEHFICIGCEERSYLDYNSILKEYDAKSPDIEINEDDIAFIGFTSGTTGTPKGVAITQKNLRYATTLYEDVNVKVRNVLHFVPLYAAGVFRVLAASLLHGIEFVVMESFDLEPFLRTIQEEKIEFFFTPPTVLYLLLKYSDLVKKFDLSSLKLIIYGSAPMQPDKLKLLIKMFPNVSFVQNYGLTETLGYGSMLPPEDHVVPEEGENKRLKSAGKESSLLEIKILSEDGKELKPGEIGEIVMRGPVVMKEYWNMPDETREAFKYGWFHTGDMGYMDEDGYIYIVDRKKDVIISGGVNIYPSEIEEVLSKHPAVAEVAVIGVPHEIWGETPKAIVVLKEEYKGKVTEEEIINYCKEHLASYKKPTSVDFVDSLPKYGPYQKINKKALREKYWKGYERRVH